MTKCVGKIRVCLLGLLCCATLVYGQSARAKFDLAQQAYDAGNYAEALTYLGEAETILTGTNSRIQSLRTLIYYDQGNKEKALEEVVKYFAVAPQSMQATDGYKAMEELRNELKTGMDDHFSNKRSQVENEHRQNIDAINKELARKTEQLNYEQVRNSESEQIIQDFLNMYPQTQYRRSLEERISRLSNEGDLHAHPEKYITQAVEDENTSLIDKLLSYKCNVNVQNGSGLYPIHLATKNNDFTTLRKLYYAGADVNMTDATGRTVLSYAIENEATTIAEFLIAVKTDVNKADDNGESPIFYAIKAKSRELVQLLLTHGAETKVTNHDGLTPLVMAIQMNPANVGIVSALLYNEKNINRKVNAYTPLDYAMSKNDADLVYVLLAYGADPNLYTSDGLTMLYLATKNRNSGIMTSLLDARADPNKQCRNGFCPIHLAVSDHQKSLVELLLSHGADINKTGQYGWTALHLACRENDGDMVAMLVSHTANKRIRDEWGRTPKKVAKEHHFKTVKKLL